MKVAFAKKVEHAPRGVALILVMLAILVLSVLAASIIFSARSETFASYNYRISTQADYVAKAGLQKALNFFNSDKYKAVDPSSPGATYEVSEYASSPVVLYNATKRYVRCIANCASNPGNVTLSVNSSGTFNGNYPTNFNNAAGDTIPTAFASNFYNVGLDPLGSATNSGQFTVSATLEEYYTVNDAFYPTINRKPYEVWHVTSTGTWNSNVGAGVAKPMSVQEATLAPVYLPYSANALYGMCDITMNGNVCTDSYNSGNGGYNGSDPGGCVSSGAGSSNAYPSGAGVGAGGKVTLNGGAYVVNGDVAYGAEPPTYSSLWACPSPSSGISGSVSGVNGTVQPKPAIPEPPMPTFPNCAWYGGPGGTSCSKNTSYALPPDPSSPGNGDYVWTRQISGIWYYETKNGGITDYLMSFPTWTATSHYTAGSVVSGGNGHSYTCTVAGTSGSSVPAWPTGSGATVTDGGGWSAWAASTAYSVAQVVKASPDNGHLYKCTAAGTSGASQPTFPTTSGGTVSEPSYPGWAVSTAYTTTSIIAPGNGHWYQPTVAGTSGTSQPSWPTASGATVTDGGTWPGWAANTAYNVGAVIHPAATTHIYTCISATGNKKSGGTAPAWPTGSGATVVDNKVTWRESGSSNGVTWQEKGILAAVTWQEIGPSSAITWTESGTSANILGGGTSDDPFRLPAISGGNNSNVCLTGGPTAGNAIYYDIKNYYSHGTTYIVNAANPPTSCPPQSGYTDYGYAVLNIYNTLDLGGQGIVQPTGANPAALVINVYNGGSNSGDSVTMSGQANLKAVVTALGGAKLGGSGSGGAFYGSILAGSIKDAGNYSVHYDQALKVLSGKLMPMAIRNYSRLKH